MVQTFTLANISDIWSFAAGGLQITATQDVTGVTVAAPSQSTTLPCTVVALQGQSITSTAPTSNQALVWNSGTSKWTPTAIVNSFNTRTGAITLTAADVGAVSSATAPAHQWFNAFSAAGAFSSSQPAFSDISGTLASTQLAVGATLAFSGNTLETAALTGDVTTAANSFVTTVSTIGGKSVTLGGTLITSAAVTFSGAFSFTGTLTGITSITFPTSGTIATTAQLPIAANPSATIVGGAAINGSATTFMRSDAAPALALTALSSALNADVALNNISNYFDGPSVAQGTSGTWYVSGTVSLIDTGGSVNMYAKLWDGTTLLSSASTQTNVANGLISISLSGIITNPTGNLRISVRDASLTTGKILHNQTGLGGDSNITAVRIG